MNSLYRLVLAVATAAFKTNGADGELAEKEGCVPAPNNERTGTVSKENERVWGVPKVELRRRDADGGMRQGRIADSGILRRSCKVHPTAGSAVQG